MRSSRTAGILIVVALGLSGGCGSPIREQDSMAEAHDQAWPAAPAEARVKFVRAFRGPLEFGIAKSPGRRMMDRLFGRTEEAFVRPTNVAARDGVVYVADPGAPALWILDTVRGQYLRISDAGGVALESPVAVAVRPDGSVYVADTRLRKVLLFDRDGKFVKMTVEGEIERPAGIAFDSETNGLFVIDSARHCLFDFASDGKLRRTIGEPGSEDGQFNHPSHVFRAADGTLLVNDALNFRVQAFDRAGSYAWKFGHNGDGSGAFAAPKGLASDSAGNIYVVDALFDTVQIFRRDGTFLLSFGERGSRPGQFWLPGGLFIDSKDRIYVADAYNGRIQMFQAMAGENR